MNLELGDMSEQKRFVKEIPVDGGPVHVICLDCVGYMVSAEISNFLWTRDILHTMLLMKHVTLPTRSVAVEAHQPLFTELIRYDVLGVMDGDDLVDPLTLYPLSHVPNVFAMFRNMKAQHDVKAVIKEVMARFDPADPYWTTSDEDDPAMSVYDVECGPPSANTTTPLPHSPLSLPARSLAADSNVATADGNTAAVNGNAAAVNGNAAAVNGNAAAVDGNAAAVDSNAAAVDGNPATADGNTAAADCGVATATDAAASLLPEMRSILAQLQTKRRRKVDATSMALEGSGFAVEDVIGDDLQQMDAQITFFQRRIDTLTSGTSADAHRPGLDCTSLARSSISMNPDAPEFVFSEGSVYASPDSTISGDDWYDTTLPEAAPSRRPRVEMRLADGVAVSLGELVSRAKAIHLSSPDGKPIDLASLVSSASSSSTTATTSSSSSPSPRRPVEVRTADGVPVSLRRTDASWRRSEQRRSATLSTQAGSSVAEMTSASEPAGPPPAQVAGAQPPRASSHLSAEQLSGATLQLRHAPDQPSPAAPAAQPLQRAAVPQQQQQQSGLTQWPRLPAQQPPLQRAAVSQQQQPVLAQWPRLPIQQQPLSMQWPSLTAQQFAQHSAQHPQYIPQQPAHQPQQQPQQQMVSWPRLPAQQQGYCLPYSQYQAYQQPVAGQFTRLPQSLMYPPQFQPAMFPSAGSAEVARYPAP